jgi:hypothetical protein
VIAGIATLPFRVGVRTAGRVVGAVEGVVELVGHVVEALLPSRPRPAATAPTRREWPRPARAPFPAQQPPAPPPEPVHVSEEPVLVAEVADEGAEDGAGAQIRIAEPWEGYRAMKAADVIARLEVASREELAVVQLYESSNRARKTVLAEVEQRLKVASSPATRRR